MKSLLQYLLLVACVVLCADGVRAEGEFAALSLNSDKTITTAQGVKGLATALGSAEDYMAVFRVASLTPGRKYEATLTFDAGTDIGYGFSIIDGNPYTTDWFGFVGIGTGTGTRALPGKQEKYLFTIDPASTSKTLYVSLRSNKPFTLKFGVSDQLSGATPNSQDQWGYYYVRDFDADKTSPFLLKR